MKKTLLLTAVFFSLFFLAQQSKFSGNYSTKSLKEIQKTIPQNQKHEFYKQYFRALYFEEMKQTFNYKDYSDVVLKKFTDTIFSLYEGGEVINNKAELFKPSITLEEHLELYKKYMAENPKETEKYLASVLKFKDDKEKKKYFEDLKLQMGSYFDKVEKSPEQLKEQYEELVSREKEQFENDPSTSIGLQRIIQKLDKRFATQETSEEFIFLLEKNFGVFGYFPFPCNEANENSVYESVPGEILTCSNETGTADGRSFKSYKITQDEIIPINIDPTSDDNFYKKVAKYAKKGWRTEPRAFYVITKNKNGEYVVSTSMYTADDFSTAPSMSIEYKTKDFKNFTPLRFANNEDEKLVWKEIK